MPRNDSDAPNRLVVQRVDDATWGGPKFGVWDYDGRMWRDDIGWFLSQERAEQALAAALPGTQKP